MGFPVTLNGITFTLADFSPDGYITAMPASIEALADQLLQPTYSTSTTSHNIASGTIVLDVGTGKAFVAGMTVLMTPSSDLAKFATGVVVSYVAGILTVTRQAGTGTGTFASWFVSQHPISTVLPLGAIAGGVATDENFRDGILSNYSPTAGMEEVLCFFPASVTPLWVSTGTGVTITGLRYGVKEWVIDCADANSLIGIRNLLDTGTSLPLPPQAGLTLTIGPPPSDGVLSQVSIRHGNQAYCPADSGGLLFAAKVTSAERGNTKHIARVGLRGYFSSMRGNIFSNFGLGFELRATLANARFDPPVPASYDLYAVTNNGGTSISHYLAPVEDIQRWTLMIELANGQVTFSARAEGSFDYQHSASFVPAASTTKAKTGAFLVQPAAQFETLTPSPPLDYQIPVYCLHAMQLIKPLLRN